MESRRYAYSTEPVRVQAWSPTSPAEQLDKSGCEMPSRSQAGPLAGTRVPPFPSPRVRLLGNRNSFGSIVLKA